MIVKAGRTYVRDLVTGAETATIAYLGVGAGVSSVTDNDTTLGTELKNYDVGTRHPLLVRPNGDRYAYFQATVSSLDSNSQTIAELGLFTHPTSGTMLIRHRPETSFSKTSTKEYRYEITLEVE